MGHKIPDRYRWAFGLLDVGTGDRILEIGCGYGQMIGLVCEHLASGRITAIDRSSKMVEAATRASGRHIASGKAQILQQELLDSLLPAASFDKVFLFNINAFWMDPVAELAAVKRLLRPDGEFYIFHQPPPGHEIEEFVTRFKINLAKNGFDIVSVKIEGVEGKEMTCVISKPSPR